jgi:hypothetical protein
MIQSVSPSRRRLIQSHRPKPPIHPDPLHHYYKPNNTAKHNRMQQRDRAYKIFDNDLYKTSTSGLLLRCVSKAEGQELLLEIHAGICGDHIGTRVVSAKVLRQGFYWPAIIDDVAKLVSMCEACQKFSHRSKAPAQPLVVNSPVVASPVMGHRHRHQANTSAGQLHLHRGGS